MGSEMGEKQFDGLIPKNIQAYCQRSGSALLQIYLVDSETQYLRPEV